ncbi:MAG: FAD-dependent oxidoreductase [Microcystaceae cyanobacterium]
MSPQGILDNRYFLRPTNDQNLSFPLLIVGGSTAAYSATLGALKAGAKVCLVQPQKVLGGQFTAQALPASDDGKLLEQKDKQPIDGEQFAISKTQKEFRQRSRQLQKVNGKVIDNPGGGWVSNFAVTPVNAAKALNEAIEPYLDSQKLTIIPLADPIQVLFTQSPNQLRQVTGVIFQDKETQYQFTVNADIIIEATDLGDLLELGQIESRVGQESRHETGETVLLDEAYPMCQQAITFCAIVEKTAQGQGIAVKKPDGYGEKPCLKTHSFTCYYKQREFFDRFGIFTYRRIQRHQEGDIPHPVNGDVTIINYKCNDYGLSALTGVSRAEREKTIQQARDYTQAYLYYLQSQPLKTKTGEVGDFKPRGDLTWTEDGIALEPYIREARRGIALRTIRYEDVHPKFFPNQARVRCFEDSIGIGQYHYLDVHPNDASGHAEIDSLSDEEEERLRFTIPLGALIPVNTNNFILSAKSIGTTHITNSAYRMHPVEWAIGEAGGHLAAFALENRVEVRQVATDLRLKRQFQGLLAKANIPLFWFDDVGHDDPDFEAIQVLAVAGIVRTENYKELKFNPKGTVNRAVVCIATVNVMGFELINPNTPSFVDVPTSHFAYSSIETLAAKNLVSGVGNQRFNPSDPCTREHLSFMVANLGDFPVNEIFSGTPQDNKPLERRELSRILYRLLCFKLKISTS